MLKWTLRAAALLAVVAALAAPIAVAPTVLSSPPAPAAVAVSASTGHARVDHPVAHQEARAYAVGSVPQHFWGAPGEG